MTYDRQTDEGREPSGSAYPRKSTSSKLPGHLHSWNAAESFSTASLARCAKAEYFEGILFTMTDCLRLYSLSAKTLTSRDLAGAQRRHRCVAPVHRRKAHSTPGISDDPSASLSAAAGSRCAQLHSHSRPIQNSVCSCFLNALEAAIVRLRLFFLDKCPAHMPMIEGG